MIPKVDVFFAGVFTGIFTLGLGLIITIAITA